MKEVIIVLSATALVPRFLTQPNLVLVRIQQLYHLQISFYYTHTLALFPHVAELASTQQLDLHKLAPQTAERQCRLQEADYQKQQAELEREVASKEMEAQKQKRLQMQLHAKLGKL